MYVVQIDQVYIQGTLNHLGLFFTNYLDWYDIIDIKKYLVFYVGWLWQNWEKNLEAFKDLL